MINRLRTELGEEASLWAGSTNQGKFSEEPLIRNLKNNWKLASRGAEGVEMYARQRGIIIHAKSWGHEKFN